MLKTWRSILNPPKPSKNAVKVMVIEIDFVFIVTILLKPLVSSTRPEMIGFIYSTFNPKILNNGVNKVENIYNNPELFKIDIITEKIITKPPIITIVLIEFIILLDNISPKLEKDKFSLELIETFLEITFSLSCSFQNLNKNPTIIHAKKCVKKSNKPYSRITK